MAQNSYAAPKWDCRATPEGEWACFQNGALIPPDKPAKALADKPKEQKKADESVKIQTIPEPTPVVAKPLNEEQATEIKPAIADEKQITPPQTEEKVVQEPPKKPTPAAPVVTVPPRQEQKRAPTATTTPQEATKKTYPEPQQPPKEPLAVKPTAMARIDEGLDWSQCYPQPLLTSPQVSTPSDGSMHISADGADLHRVENRAFFKGDVEIINGDLNIKADAAEYDRTTGIFDAQGNVLLQQPTLRMASKQLTYDTQNEKGSATDVEYRLLDRAARGNADTAAVTGSDLSNFTQVSYTTCKPGNEDWILNATDMELDKGTGVGQAKNVSVSFKGVPFFYTPYISFPIDDRRKSGVLIPTIGSSENTGMDISVPYYFNIAPHMDATVTPRIMSKRGLMLGGEFRYLAKNFEGEVRTEVLPNDKERAAGESKNRGALSLQAKGTPAANWSYNFDINHISDDDYLDDFGNSLAATSEKHQERRGDINYQGNGWSFLGRLQTYQTIDKTVAVSDQPYERLPQLLINLEKPDQAYGLTYHLSTEYVSFGRSSDTKVTGDRINFNPGISLPLRRSWGFLTPKISIDHTTYNLDNQATGLDDSPNRTLPTFSMDGGLIFERESNLFNTALTQTLEPRLYYLYTPKEDQSEIPDFDTSSYGFSFANLFRENRFNGTDKIGDANQLTTALTTRFLDSESGKELLQASIGQIFYFRDREVQLQAASGSTEADDSSSLVAAISANLGSNWRADAGVQWSPHHDANDIEQSSAGLHYKNGSNHIVNATYRYTNGSIDQTDISARWPITHSLAAVGRWNYSLLHNQTMEAFGGIEYSNCCWTTRFVARDYRSGADSTSNLAFFIQLELKGLTSIGDKVDKFLEDGILGYAANKK